MMPDRFNNSLPAPCIIDTGIIVNKQDILRLLADLGRVRYLHFHDGLLYKKGEGYVTEVFADRERSTLIANHRIYLNVSSFDCLELKESPEGECYFDLVHEGRLLRLIPLSNPMQEQGSRTLENAALEAVLREVLIAKLDAEIDDEGMLPF